MVGNITNHVTTTILKTLKIQKNKKKQKQKQKTNNNKTKWNNCASNI